MLSFHLSVIVAKFINFNLLEKIKNNNKKTTTHNLVFST